ncbi:hypothetical protein SAE02_59780 [Skermanella aerolata]|jgi:type IV secretory pathway TraG/TraD family ATPase VirD4|uniref:Uncharacterized protein n=1 Tax=Skermanella aerolata TaxID=393310 RepID=A0A512E046_9PROT|nr:hypothetical protein [Skermanella aerolata]KJB91077.1 hypothetical protein N826_30460 [Skermanella aerolata KACC 11604]GEO41830.1 hypothetical protein SAE02_59780 [Skermanella aerolata]
MRAWWAWLQVAQHEWWFVPAGLGLLAVTVAAVVLMRIAVSRASSWLLNPRMKGTEAQVEAVWATEEDLVKFGLIKPRRRGIRAWMPTLGRG